MSFYDFVARFRPIDQWPGKSTPKRKNAPFRADWRDTLDLIRRELRMLEAKNIVIQVALEEREIRQDGYPRSDARPRHPGIIISFSSIHGPLKYACDTYSDWKDNMRAIALGLNALRAVDRYGITKRGEQYSGWKELPLPRTDGAMTVEQAADQMVRMGGGNAERVIRDPEYRNEVYRRAAANSHPDRYPHLEEDFKRLQEARRVLDQAGGGK